MPSKCKINTAQYNLISFWLANRHINGRMHEHINKQMNDSVIISCSGYGATEIYPSG